VNDHVHLAGKYAVLWNRSEWKYSYTCESSDGKKDLKLAEKRGKEVGEPVNWITF